MIEFNITRETLEEVGVDPQLIVEQIEQIRAIYLKPTYVAGYHLLKQETVSS